MFSTTMTCVPMALLRGKHRTVPGRDVRRADDILKAASALFLPAELDRCFKGLVN